MKNNNLITKLVLVPFLVFLFAISTSFGQELKIDFPKGKIIINGAGNLNVEGYDGTDVLIYEMLYEQNRPDLMEGLTMLNSNKPDHLKEVDIEHKIKGEVLTITAHGRSGRYHLKVPRGLDVSTTSHGKNYYYYDGLKNLNFKNLDGEIEVFTDGSVDVNIEKTTGSISVVTYGNITGVFEELPKNGALSFDTYRGYVNLTLPENVKADFSLSAKKGAIFSNLPIKMKNKNRKEVQAISNGGGVDIMINTETGGDIYLRKL